MKSLAIRIHGRVQGVGFRHHAAQVAIENSIKGIIKNMVDGSVYIEAAGNDDQIEKFVSWCSEGPRWAHVEDVEVVQIDDKGYSGFSVQ